MPYEWKQNNACTATYKVLESEMFMDQFEERDVPFEEAGSFEMGKLVSYPKTTNNPNIIKSYGVESARIFIKYIKKIHVIKRQSSDYSSADIIFGLGAIFSDKNKTLVDLAEAIDSFAKFPDE